MFKKLALTLLCLCLTPAVIAAGATKVAVLDLQALVLGSDAGKAGMGELEKKPEYAELKAKVESLQAQLKELDKQGKAEELTWSEEQKKQHKEKMTEVAKERQGVILTLNRAREAVFMQLLNVMEPAIGQVLEMVMAKEGIELVIDSKSALHKMPSADITLMVIDQLNKLSAEALKKAQTGGAKKADK